MVVLLFVSVPLVIFSQTITCLKGLSPWLFYRNIILNGFYWVELENVLVVEWKKIFYFIKQKLPKPVSHSGLIICDMKIRLILPSHTQPFYQRQIFRRLTIPTQWMEIKVSILVNKLIDFDRSFRSARSGVRGRRWTESGFNFVVKYRRLHIA